MSQGHGPCVMQLARDSSDSDVRPPSHPLSCLACDGRRGTKRALFKGKHDCSKLCYAPVVKHCQERTQGTQTTTEERSERRLPPHDGTVRSMQRPPAPRAEGDEPEEPCEGPCARAGRPATECVGLCALLLIKVQVSAHGARPGATSLRSCGDLHHHQQHCAWHHGAPKQNGEMAGSWTRIHAAFKLEFRGVQCHGAH